MGEAKHCTRIVICQQRAFPQHVEAKIWIHILSYSDSDDWWNYNIPSPPPCRIRPSTATEAGAWVKGSLIPPTHQPPLITSGLEKEEWDKTVGCLVSWGLVSLVWLKYQVHILWLAAGIVRILYNKEDDGRLDFLMFFPYALVSMGFGGCVLVLILP